MEVYTPAADIGRDTRWRTAFIVLQDDQGRVFVDPSRSNFANQIDREATTEDAIYMLGMAFEEFKQDRTRALIMAEFKALMEKVEAR